MKHRRGEGQRETQRKAFLNKTPVFGMIERGGRVRAEVMPHVPQDSVERSVFFGVDRERTRLITDGHAAYGNIDKMLPHAVIRHETEFVRGDVHTQNIESFWALLKRGLVGTYHHVDVAYLHQYVAEFEFRHNQRQTKDVDCFKTLLSQIDGRLDWYVGQQAS